MGFFILIFEVAINFVLSLLGKLSDFVFCVKKMEAALYKKVIDFKFMNAMKMSSFISS